jgi:hypothetical protein
MAMVKNTPESSMSPPAFPVLEDFGALQARYQPLPLSKRALAVLRDAEPALTTCGKLLNELSQQPAVSQVFDTVRNNPLLIGKMRPSEAKNALMDKGSDFIAVVAHKLGAWQKTMERIGAGEGILVENKKEYIQGDAPVAIALLSVSALDAYLAVIQVALAEMAKVDAASASHYQSTIAKIRRCATLLSDYDSASALRAVIH